MSNPPLFSLAVPTKNRSFLLPDTINAVLNQTFADWELIIADNDDTDATRKIVNSYLSDPRIKYYRSGGLSMPDNWEFAADKTCGEYLCILEDKSLLKPRALSRIASEIFKERHESITWRSDVYNDIDVPPRVIFDLAVDGSTTRHHADEILKMIVNCESMDSEKVIPFPQHSCLHRNLIDKIKKSPCKRLFPPCSPDMQCIYLQLAYTDYIIHIKESLVLIGSCRHSNGRSSVVNGPAFQQFTKDMGGCESIYYDRMPVKAISITGTNLNDFSNTRDLVGGRLLKHEINLKSYFVDCYKFFLKMPASGVNNSKQLYAWRTALDNQPLDFQDAVKQEIAKLGSPLLVNFKARMKYWRKVSGWKSLERLVKNILGIKKKSGQTFLSAMEYIDWDHQIFLRSQQNHSK